MFPIPHGDEGFGYREDGIGIAIGRQDFLNAATDGTIRALIETGKTGTPMVGLKHDEELEEWTLDAREIDSIILFLRTEAMENPK